MKADLVYDPERAHELMQSCMANQSMTFHFPDGTEIVYPPGAVRLENATSKVVWGVKWVWGFIPWPERLYEIEYTFVVQEKDRNVL